MQTSVGGAGRVGLGLVARGGPRRSRAGGRRRARGRRLLSGLLSALSLRPALPPGSCPLSPRSLLSPSRPLPAPRGKGPVRTSVLVLSSDPHAV